MRLPDFQKLPEGPKTNNVGEKFLEGEKMLDQKNKAVEGSLVTYFEIVNINERGNIEYIPKYDRLEK